MNEILILIIKGLAGGGLVVAFAVLSEGLSPKRFAGLFSAAPAVALAGRSCADTVQLGGEGRLAPQLKV